MQVEHIKTVQSCANPGGVAEKPLGSPAPRALHHVHHTTHAQRPGVAGGVGALHRGGPGLAGRGHELSWGAGARGGWSGAVTCPVSGRPWLVGASRGGGLFPVKLSAGPADRWCAWTRPARFLTGSVTRSPAPAARGGGVGGWAVTPGASPPPVLVPVLVASQAPQPAYQTAARRLLTPTTPVTPL